MLMSEPSNGQIVMDAEQPRLPNPVSDVPGGLDDYESLTHTYSLWVHMAAGAAAGLAEHCVMFPIDTVKTRKQSLPHCPDTKCFNPIRGALNIGKKEGWLRPLRGVNAVAAGSIPAHALYFTVYEKTKSYLTGDTRTHWNTLSYGAAGVVATAFHDLVMNPAEVVKQRLQMVYSPYGGSLQCIRCIYRNEGIAAFYRSYTTQLFMNVPFQAFHFMGYEFWQQVLNPQRNYDPKSHVLAGALAGGLAAAITNPLDCIKTVLNTQQVPKIQPEQIADLKTRVLYIRSSYKGILDATKSIYANRGLSGFGYGLQARVLYQMPSTALSWSVYELFKFLLSQ